MNWINIWVSEEEFAVLRRSKGDDTWNQFILRKGGGDEYISSEAFDKIMAMKKKMEKEEHGYITVSEALDALLFG